MRQIRLESTEHSLEMKQAFVRYLSHEMRTPVNIALIGLGIHQQYLMDKNILDSECNETISDVKGAIIVVLDTLNEVLNYEKLYSKAMVLEKTLEDPHTFILNSLNLFKVSAQNARINLVLPEGNHHLNNSLLPVDFHNKRIDVDVHKMGQVLRNFVSNALKFTPSGGTITVEMRAGELTSLRPDLLRVKTNSHEWLYSMFANKVLPSEWIEISVTDSGVGIAAENLHRVFNEIVQFNPNQNQGGNGSGLGMYISKGIAELHGGSVCVQSDGLDKGSRFSVWLPLVSEPSNEESIAIHRSSLLEGGDLINHERQEVDRNIPVLRNAFPVVVKPNSENSQLIDIECIHPKDVADNINMCELLSPPTDQQLVKTKVDSLAGFKMLMVDDSVPNLKLCVKLFTRLGADVDSASDGSIAVKMVQAKLARTAGLSTDALLFRFDDEITGDKDRQYDIIVMDNLMPVMNGQDACEQMRRMGYNGVILGLTGNALPKDLAEYQAHGANAVLTKPLVMNDFFAALQRCDI